jgi:iron complex transport system substrate-binding protein
VNSLRILAAAFALLPLGLSQAASARQSVAIQNCGFPVTYATPPKRAVAMNQPATEILLALGLQDRVVGTAYLDDAILPAFAEAYRKIPVLAAKYPSREALLSARPDFVYGSYASAFAPEAAGSREELARLGTDSYLSPSGCGAGRRPAHITMGTVYDEIRDIGRIFGVSARAEQLIASYQADIRATQATIGVVTRPPRLFWYDSGDPPSAGACCGVPDEIIRLVGAENVFKDTPGSWKTVSWEEVIARNPDAMVLIDAEWSPAADKRRLLDATRAYASIDAIKAQRFVTIDFSASTPGIRIVAAVRKLAEALYPDKFR